MTHAQSRLAARHNRAPPGRRHIPAGPGRGAPSAQRRTAQRAQRRGPPPPTQGEVHAGKSRGFFVTLFWRNEKELDHYKSVLAQNLLSCTAQSAGLEICPTTGRPHIHVAYNLEHGTSTWGAQRKKWRLPLSLSAGPQQHPPPISSSSVGVAPPLPRQVNASQVDNLTGDDFERAAESAANARANYGDTYNSFRYACNVQFIKCFKAAHKYCAKDELMAEFSKMPKGQGKRTDIDEFHSACDDFKAGSLTVQDLWKNHFNCMLRYGKGFSKYVNDHVSPRDFCTFMLVIHGPPNSGKTSWVKKMFDPDVLTFNPQSNFFSMPDTCNSPVCLFDDPDLSSWKPDTIKALSNHCELSCNVKGGHRQFTYKLIVITINELPNNATWDEAVLQRLGLSCRGERGSLIDWPDATVNSDGHREVLVPLSLADECHQCRDIRGPHCFSKPWEYSTCECPASLRTHTLGASGTRVCHAIHLQKSLGPGATFVIPRGAPSESAVTAAYRARVQQPEPQEQQPPAQSQDHQSDSPDVDDMSGSDESDPDAESGYDSDDANRVRAAYDRNRAKRDRIGPDLFSALGSDSDDDGPDCDKCRAALLDFCECPDRW